MYIYMYRGQTFITLISSHADNKAGAASYPAQASGSPLSPALWTCCPGQVFKAVCVLAAGPLVPSEFG